MIGAILGAVVIGALVDAYCNSSRKISYWEYCNIHKKEYELKQKELELARTEQRLKQSYSRIEKQVVFFDTFRALDCSLARYVGEGYKGVTYLIKGMYEQKGTYSNMIGIFKNIKNYRGQLSHDKRKWVNIPAPSDNLLRDMDWAVQWFNKNKNLAGRLVYAGKKAFVKQNQAKLNQKNRANQKYSQSINNKSGYAQKSQRGMARVTSGKRNSACCRRNVLNPGKEYGYGGYMKYVSDYRRIYS